MRGARDWGEKRVIGRRPSHLGQLLADLGKNIGRIQSGSLSGAP